MVNYQLLLLLQIKNNYRDEITCRQVRSKNLPIHPKAILNKYDWQFLIN